MRNFHIIQAFFSSMAATHFCLYSTLCFVHVQSSEEEEESFTRQKRHRVFASQHQWAKMEKMALKLCPGAIVALTALSRTISE